LSCALRVCPALYPPLNAEFVGTRANCSGVVHGQVCATRCSEGFDPSGGDARHECRDGAWQGTELLCMPRTCPALASPNHTKSLVCADKQNGKWCRHSFSPGYARAAGVNLCICLLGHWTAEPLQCERQVYPPLTVGHAGVNRTCTGMVKGDECVLECPMGGEQMRGSARRAYIGGQWAGAQLECAQILYRDLLPPPNTAGPACSTYAHGQQCRLICTEALYRSENAKSREDPQEQTGGG
jgi:hypothetical protein